MRRSFFIVLAAALTSGCSFVYDFSEFRAADAAADAAMPSDAADLGEPDLGPADAGTDANVDAATPISLEEFLDGLREAICAKSLRCVNKLGIAGLAQMVCHPEFGRLMLAQYEPMPFDPAAAERCLLALGSTDCSVSGDFFVASGCEDVLRGDATTGEACLGDADCTSGQCVEQEAACGLVCEARGSVDAICAANGDCTPLLRCRDARCAVPGAVGEVCDESADCDPLLWCTPGLGARMCAVVPNDGEDCVADYLGDPCIGSLVCTLALGGGHTCVVGGDATDPCDTDHPCRPGLRCSEAGSTIGTCIALSASGGPCLSAQNCPVLHECVGDVCVAYPMLGEACTPTLPCLTGGCVGDVCSPLPTGDPCGMALGSECSGYCRDTGASSVCADLLATGTPCTEDAECMPGAECLGPLASAVCTVCTP